MHLLNKKAFLEKMFYHDYLFVWCIEMTWKQVQLIDIALASYP